MCTKHKEMFAALAAPFASAEIKSRPQGGRQLKYVTARTIMNRLDNVLGPENWWDEYTPLEKSVICRLSIRLPDGQVLTKCDAGGYAGMADAGDDDKSGFSDAFKRTAVKFGAGRYLYQDGVATLTDAGGDAPAATVATPPPSPAPTRAPAAAVVRQPQPANKRPVSGEELHFYARENKIDTNLYNWIVNSFNPQGFPAKIVDWTPDEVRRAWPSIREHLETVRARARVKVAS